MIALEKGVDLVFSLLVKSLLHARNHLDPYMDIYTKGKNLIHPRRFYNINTYYILHTARVYFWKKKKDFFFFRLLLRCCLCTHTHHLYINFLSFWKKI